MDPAQMLLAMSGQMPVQVQARPVGGVVGGMMGAGHEALLGAAMMGPASACMGLAGMAIPGAHGLVGVGWPGSVMGAHAVGCGGINRTGSALGSLTGTGGIAAGAGAAVGARGGVYAGSAGARASASGSGPPRPSHDGTVLGAARDFVARHRQDQEFLHKLRAHLEKHEGTWSEELEELEKEVDGVPLICRNQVLLVKMGQLVPQKWTDYDDPEDVASIRDGRTRASPDSRRSRTRDQRRERSRSRGRKRRKSRSRSRRSRPRP